MKKLLVKKEKIEEKISYLESVCDKVGEIAVHYGFTVVKPPQILSGYTSEAKQFKEFDYYEDAEEKIALLNWYSKEKMDMASQPLSIHYRKPLPGSTKKKSTHDVYGFEIMGSVKSTSEALLLKCALAVLEDLGYTDIYVDVNSIGDRESIAKFERDLMAYLRKHGPDMPAKLRDLCKKNHYCVLTDTSPENEQHVLNAPQPIGSLSEIARLHFKEVLESLEMFGVMYKIRPNILSNKLYASHTVFEIRKFADPEKGPSASDELLAYGYRYNHLAKKIGAKREIPSIGLSISVKKNLAANKKILIKNLKKPKYYLVQLGGTAKLKALNVVEMLRKHKIPVYHSITKDKITGQLTGAEYMHATHVLIMGQKEALENSIVVRDIQTREQETISLANLPEFLKKLESNKK